MDENPYESPDATPSQPRSTRGKSNPRRTVIGMLSGAVATPIALLLALMSAGAGHGHYTIARLIYSFPMLLTRVTHNTIETPSILIAIVQLPLYGFLWDRRQWLILAAAIAIHVIAAALCFRGWIPNFS